MKAKKVMAFEVTVKIIPKGSYRHLFMRGIVTGKTEKEIEDYAIKTIKEGKVGGPDIDYEVEIFKKKRLHAEFILMNHYPSENETKA